MRVLAVTTWLPTRARPHLGTFVLRDARALADAGHEVALVHLVSAGQAGPGRRQALRSEQRTLEGIPVTRILMNTTSAHQIAAAGHRLSRWSQGADLVHTMAFPTLLALSWWRPRSPWVHTEHWSGLTAPGSLPATHRLARPALRPLLRRPDVVTAVTGQLAAAVHQVRGDRATAVVPCVAEPPRSLSSRDPHPTTLRLVSVGALIERKDPLLAVDTLAELTRRGRSARLRVVGEGPLGDHILRRAEEHGIGGLVELAGALPADGVAAELAGADVFLGPTRGENFFVACAEAVLAGRPVVVGSSGGHVDYLDERVSVCVADRDPAAYADAVDEVLRRSHLLSAEQISDTLGSRFSPAVVAAGYTEAYELASATAPAAGGV